MLPFSLLDQQPHEFIGKGFVLVYKTRFIKLCGRRDWVPIGVGTSDCLCVERIGRIYRDMAEPL
jgi:hypothetical protein